MCGRWLANGTQKVKCQQTNEGPCDRCIQSTLSCTREIQRKKRGEYLAEGQERNLILTALEQVQRKAQALLLRNCAARVNRRDPKKPICLPLTFNPWKCSYRD